MMQMATDIYNVESNTKTRNICTPERSTARPRSTVRVHAGFLHCHHVHCWHSFRVHYRRDAGPIPLRYCSTLADNSRARNMGWSTTSRCNLIAIYPAISLQAHNTLLHALFFAFKKPPRMLPLHILPPVRGSWCQLSLSIIPPPPYLLPYLSPSFPSSLFLSIASSLSCLYPSICTQCAGRPFPESHDDAGA